MKKYLCTIVLVIVMTFVCLFASFALSEHNTEKIEKDKSASLGSDNNPYVILEVVPDEAYAEMGYLVGGEEPVDLNTMLSNAVGTTTNVEAARDILKTICNTSEVNGVQEISYVVKNQNYETGKELTASSSDEVVLDGYFLNVGANKGNFKISSEGAAQFNGYVAKSWHMTIPNPDYSYVYAKKLNEYLLIDQEHKQDMYRLTDGEYYSYASDIANLVDVKKYDYAYKRYLRVLPDGATTPVYVLPEDISSDTYTIVEGKRVYEFKPVEENQGDFIFVPVYRGIKYKFDNDTYQWVKAGNLATNDTINVLNTYNYNMNYGVGSRIRCKVLANLGEGKVTELSLKNKELFKKEVLELTDSKIDEYKVRVIVRKLAELDKEDIENANLIYFNDGGDKDSYRYNSIVKLYKRENNLADTWEPSIQHLSVEGDNQFYQSDLQNAMTYIYSYLTIGGSPEDLSYSGGVANVNENGKPVVLFDSGLYDYAQKEYGTVGKNLTIANNIKKYSLEYTGASGQNKSNYLIYTNSKSEYLYKNPVTKLYTILNMMYPQTFFKQYIEHNGSTDSIDLSHIKLPNIEVSNSNIVTDLNNKILLPIDINNGHMDADTYLQMGIDNPNLTAKYLVEHGVLSYDSNRDGNILYNFMNHVIDKSVNTEEAFDTLELKEDQTQISFAEALNYLVKHQVSNIIDQNEMNILELEPCNSFMSSTGWDWRLHGFAPYYLGKIKEFDNLTNQMPIRQFVGVNKNLLDNFDLVYIGDNTDAMNVGFASSDNIVRKNISIVVSEGETAYLTPSDVSKVTMPYGAVLLGSTGGASFYFSNNTSERELADGVYRVTGLEHKTGQVYSGDETLILRVYTNANKTSYIDSSKFKVRYVTISSPTNELMIDGDSNNAMGNADIPVSQTIKPGNTLAAGNKYSSAPSGEYAIATKGWYMYVDTDNKLKISKAYETDADGNILDKYKFIWDAENRVLTNKGTGQVVSEIDTIGRGQNYGGLSYFYVGKEKINCGMQEHTHTAKPRNNPTHANQISGCWKAVRTSSGGWGGWGGWGSNYEWQLYQEGVDCPKYEHTHEQDCYRYNLFSWDYVDSNTSTLGDSNYTDVYTISESDLTNYYHCMVWDIRPINTVNNTVAGKYFNYYKSFHSSDVTPDYSGDNFIEGMSIDFSKWINPAHTYDVQYKVKAVTTNSNYAWKEDVDPSKLFVKSKNVTSATEYKFDVTVSYKTSETANTRKHMLVHLYIYELPDEEQITSTHKLFDVKYNDENMQGLIYSHAGDSYVIRIAAGTSTAYYGSADGAVGKDGTSDILNNRLHYVTTPEIKKNGTYRFYTRFSGNDITKKKMAELQEFVNADMPVIVSDKLVSVKNGVIDKPDDYYIDNSSYLYEFINNNKEKIMYSSQSSIGVWDKAFAKNVRIVADETPTLYNEGDNGVTDADYLLDRKLRFNFQLKSKDTNAKYTLKIYIDSNADGIFDKEKEELKNVTITSGGGRVSNNSLKTDTYYVVDKVIPDEFFGSIYWKLEVVKNSDEAIHDALTGVSAVKTDVENRPTILSLQVVPTKKGSSNEHIYGVNSNNNQDLNLVLDDTLIKYGKANTSSKKIREMMNDINDFNIFTMASSPNNLLTESGEVKDIFGYKVTTKFYTSPNLEDTNTQELTGKLVTNKTFNYSNCTVTISAPLEMDTGISLIPLEEAEASGIEYKNYLGTYTIQKYTGKFTSSDGITEDNKDIYVYRFIQGVGFKEIYDYSEEDNPAVENTTNTSESPEVIAIDMLVMGFGDWMYYTDNDNLIAAIREHIELGKTVLMAHDTIYYTATDAKDMVARFGGRASDYAEHGLIGWSKMFLNFKDLLSVDSYGTNSKGEAWDTLWKPRSNRKEVLSNEIQGWSDTAITTKVNRTSETESGYMPFVKTVSESSDIKPNNTRNNITTTTVDLVNRGQITEYPYHLPDRFNVSTTHSQYWKLNAEDDVAVWLTLSVPEGKNPGGASGNWGTKKWDNFNKDTLNNYYIYSKGSILYSGVGHTGDYTNDELRLFVNCIISSYKGEVAAATMMINNYDASTYGADTYIYIDKDFDEPDKAEEDTLKQKIKFNLVENNLVTNPNIEVEFGEPNVEGDTTITPMNFSEKTHSVLEDGGTDVKLFRYTDDIDNAEEISSGANMASNYNYYLLIPEDIIKWYSKKLDNEDRNSYILYAKLTFSYKLGIMTEGEDTRPTKSVSTIQRIIFVKRDQFMMG